MGGKACAALNNKRVSSMSMKYLVAAALVAGFAAASTARAETVWAPPAEIAGKAKEAAGAAAAESKPAAAAEAKKPATPAEKQKDCKAQADAKGLHGKARKTFTAECVKG